MFSYEHKVQYYETDKMGVVHHSNYIRWFEECRIDWMEQAGNGYTRMEKSGIICPVVSISCSYKSMTEFGDVVAIYPVIEKFNGVRLGIFYTIKDKESDTVRCTGNSSHCFLNKKGQPLNLKKASPELYDMFQSLINC